MININKIIVLLKTRLSLQYGKGKVILVKHIVSSSCMSPYVEDKVKTMKEFCCNDDEVVVEYAHMHYNSSEKVAYLGCVK